jgi:hypothetical protein
MKKIFSIIFVLLFILISSVIVYADNSYTTSDYVYEKLTESVLTFKDEITIKTNGEIQRISFNKLQEEVQKKNQVLSGNITSIAYEQKGNELKVSFAYLMNKYEYDRSIKMAEKVAKQLEGLSDYQKIKATHDYLIDIYTYSYMHQGPYDGLYKGLTNCTGYAMSFQMIMDYCNIPCQYIDNDTHAWNLVKVDNLWYNIDATWDDREEQEPSYEYFLKGNSVFDTSHGANEICEYDSYNADLSFKHPINNETARNKVIVIVLVGAVVIVISFEGVKHKKGLRKNQTLQLNQQSIQKEWTKSVDK